MTQALMSGSQCLLEIAIPLPIHNVFSYSIPDSLAAKAQTGVRVRVPFKNRELIGYVVARRDGPPEQKLKPIVEILDDAPVLTKPILELTKWISEYYGSSWGEAIENALPKWVKYGKKAARALQKAASATVSSSSPPAVVDYLLTEDQKAAFDFIESSFEKEKPRPVLLYGVTGSGKSEVYIRAIRAALSRNGSTICLVPEIALTEQLRRFFYQHFGEDLEILHSKLTDGERFAAWKRIEDSRRRVVLGPRSAIFAPVPSLKLIIIDEEHENSYKQETAPRYHAREVAFWRSQNENALLVMGSATPSLEIMEQTRRGAVHRLDLKSRIDNKAMPTVQIFDLKEAAAAHKKIVLMTPQLIKEIEINLKRKEGTMLLLNRRGFSTHIHCPKCGQMENCSSCQVSLTFHQESSLLLCHYCNFQKPVPSVCGHCQSPVLKFAGFGTEKVESEAARYFPSAQIARMDADSVKKRGSHEVILSDFRSRRIDILIGTQMIAKGFDFPHVTLVGVILADVGLMLPDFRSAEKTFQLLTQVAGRPGRGEKPGRVIIQTFSPDHPSIRFARLHDYAGFFGYETQQRYQYRYPPYCRLTNIIIRSKIEKKAYQAAWALKETLMPLATPRVGGSGGVGGIEVIGPAPLPFYKLRGHFRWHIMLKYPPEISLTSKLVSALAKLQKFSGVQTALDVDPVNIL